MRTLLIGLLLGGCLQKGNAQFYHQVGAGVIVGSGRAPAGAAASADKPSYAVYGAFYFPRINVFENKHFSFSAGVPVTAGILANANSGGSRIGFGADLPLMVDLSAGAGASDLSESTIGGFIGAGFGLTHSNQKYTYRAPGWTGVEKYGGTSYGPVVHTGFRYQHLSYDFTIRLFYKKGLEQQRFQTFGIAGSTSF